MQRPSTTSAFLAVAIITVLIFGATGGVAVKLRADASDETATARAAALTATSSAPTRTATVVLPASPTAAASLTVQVRADLGWQEVGIAVQRGDLVQVRYLSGRWSPWPGGSYDANGCSWDECDERHVSANNVTMPENHASLIGRIGSGEAFAVGAYVAFTASTAGQLALRINDEATGDNAGAITISIAVTS
jgi:hypothetical protein